MVKLIFLCSRRPTISHTRYAELLLEGHVPLALRHHPTLRKYVVNIVEAPLAPGARALDSIGELYFDTLADFHERLYDSPEGRAAIEADVAGFMGRVAAYYVEEEVALPGPRLQVTGTRSPVMKMMTCLRRAEPLDHRAFLARWRDHRTPLVLRVDESLVGYVRNAVVDRLGSEGTQWDGIETRYFSPATSAETALDLVTPGGADRARFVGEWAAYRVAEYIQRL